jgi:hypothetical protein
VSTASALLRFTATVTALLGSSCIDWSRFHGPDARDGGSDETVFDGDSIDAHDAADDLATTDADASFEDIVSDGDATMSDIAADNVCPNPGPPDYCATIASLPTEPVLDGILECGVPLQRFTAADYYPLNGPLPSGLMASFAAAWRPDGLYVYGQLEGSNDDPAIAPEGAYCGDDLEIYVDHDGVFSAMYDTDGTRQLLIAAPPPGMATGGFAQIYRNRVFQADWADTHWVSRRIGGVVHFEAMVSAADLGLASWSLAAAQHIGFDMGLTLGTGGTSDGGTDAGSCHHILGHFYFRLAPGDAGCSQPSCDPLAFCMPALAP